MRTHFQSYDRQGKSGANPEPPRHVDQFWTGSAISTDARRLERHAANGATARTRCANLRMHGAGVNGAGGSRWRFTFAFGRKLLGLFGELGPTAGRAEIINTPGMDVAMRRFRRIERHPADRVDFT